MLIPPPNFKRPFEDIQETEHLHTLIRKPGGILLFAERVLGLPTMLHPGQVKWLKNTVDFETVKRINILRTGNKWSKSFTAAIKHLYHVYLKWNMWGQYRDDEEWINLKYDTLNFGPGYEQAREVPRMMREIAQGQVFIPIQFQRWYGSTNRSLLKDWFIVGDKVDSITLPHLKFWNGASTLIRSYDDMGAAFKMKGIAYVSGDEVADIKELWQFTNGTLLPRGVAYRNFTIDYYGTPQPDGFDYQMMIEMAEEDMKKPDYQENGMFYVQKGSMMDNPFLNEETVNAIRKISDPEMRRQIIAGEFVQSGTKYFGFDRVMNAVDSEIKQQDEGLATRRYVISCDFAGGESTYADYTVIGVIDATEEPYRLVHFTRVKAKDMPIPMQYKYVDEIYQKFRHGRDCRLVIDASALGGKNAQAFLKHLNPITLDIKANLKAEMLATLKIALDGGQSEIFKRELTISDDGEHVDNNPTWGIIRIPNIKPLIDELLGYKLEDQKIRTDCVMMLAMGVHYIEMKRPRKIKNKMVPFDVLSM